MKAARRALALLVALAAAPPPGAAALPAPAACRPAAAAARSAAGRRAPPAALRTARLLPAGALALPLSALPALPRRAEALLPRAGAAPARASGRRESGEGELRRLSLLFDGLGRTRSDDGIEFELHGSPAGGAPRLRRVAQAPGAARPVPGTEGLSGAPLLAALREAASRGHRKDISYGEARSYLFLRADGVELGGVRGIVDAYSGVFVPGSGPRGEDYRAPDGRRPGAEEEMNTEHLWPQSFFRERLPMRSDLHHLMATLERPNTARDTFPFGEVAGPWDYSNASGARQGGGFFEPPDFSKGRVARAMLYFFARYGDHRIFSGGGRRAWWGLQVRTLLSWNRRFPPDEWEARRNDLVEAFQGNRNPFVDDPSLADRVGAAAWAVGPPRSGGRGEFRRPWTARD